jgi:hypothetical protein
MEGHSFPFVYYSALASGQLSLTFPFSPWPMPSKVEMGLHHSPGAISVRNGHVGHETEIKV